MLTWPSFANIDKRQERLLCRWPCVRSLNAEIKVRSRNVTGTLLVPLDIPKVQFISIYLVEDIFLLKISFCCVSSLTMKRSLFDV